MDIVLALIPCIVILFFDRHLICHVEFNSFTKKVKQHQIKPQNTDEFSVYRIVMFEIKIIFFGKIFQSVETSLIASH